MNTFIESFLELIYPEKNNCYICDEYNIDIGDKYICISCENKLHKLIAPFCIKCNKPISSEFSYNLCPECVKTPKYFETEKAPYKYMGLIKHCIYEFKYHNKPYFYKLLGSLLVKYMYEAKYTDFDFVMSVPIHRNKLKTRGFNQSKLIASFVSKKLKIPYNDGLKRIINTTKQSSRSKYDREKNLKNVFSVNNNNYTKNIIGKKILLVDDIYTTGATVNEISKILIEYGVDKVFIITIAR